MLIGFLKRRMIAVDDLHRRLAGGEKFLILDVREPAELSAGRIPGAVNVPLRILQSEGREMAAGSNLPVVLCCRSGLRSLLGLMLLGAPALSLQGGMTAWRRRGFEVIGEAGERPAPVRRREC
jgi:rhodanese-related sulfurtransferase